MHDSKKVFVEKAKTPEQLSQGLMFRKKLEDDSGMLFQFGALFTDLSVFENVAFPIREHTDLPESMVRDFVMLKLNAVGLRGAHNLMPTELSGGMSRRVALARAVALDPHIIMYDEPFAGLDPISMGVVCNLIRSLNDALGATSIVVTHDVHETFTFVDYIYFVSGGIVVAEGTPDELRNSEMPFVHQFVHGEADGPTLRAQDGGTTMRGATLHVSCPSARRPRWCSRADLPCR
jgi:phospholipid/cholesterol/gamma-HCH transport system ATP-binding protein